MSPLRTRTHLGQGALLILCVDEVHEVSSYMPWHTCGGRVDNFVEFVLSSILGRDSSYQPHHRKRFLLPEPSGQPKRLDTSFLSPSSLGKFYVTDRCPCKYISIPLEVGIFPSNCIISTTKT